MNRFICIHGHFYQPPRENPWLEAIERQDSAFPYHDWNEKTTAESYEPNAKARIMDGDRIVETANNYASISYNFGPTLLSWMEKRRPGCLKSLVEADRTSSERFSGHGNAVAQIYNHMIMPLANARDKKTQAWWGIRDFKARFDRIPEGMWLPETAVDLETLDILAGFDVRYTILAPHQAARFRSIGESGWTEVSSEKFDLKRPYLCRLSSGREIVIFFYDGAIAQEVAFGNLLEDGIRFAERLVSAFAPDEGPQIVNIATDGETYGHHHRFGEMALAYCLRHIEKHGLARITNYAEFMERFPPRHEVEIVESTSWSCVHGVERWRSDCGCRFGNEKDWSLAWRSALRKALDTLRDDLAQVFESEIGKYFKDPWEARQDYIEVVLDRALPSYERFMVRHGIGDLTYREKRKCLAMLEMQRNAMLMYASCGWFFDDVSGLETRQILQYAAMAIQLAANVTDRPIEAAFIKNLEKAKSNDPEWGDGGIIYKKTVEAARIDQSDTPPRADESGIRKSD